MGDKMTTIDTSTDAAQGLMMRLGSVSLQAGYPSRTILVSAVIWQAIETIAALLAERDAAIARADAAERGSGSLALLDAARAVMVACRLMNRQIKDPDLGQLIADLEKALPETQKDTA